MKRGTLSIFLTLVLLSSAACANAGQTSVTTESSLSPVTSAGEPAETESKSGTPDNLDLNNQEIRIWSPSDTTVVSESYINMDAEQTGDILDDAIFAATRAAEEKLNVQIKFDTDILVSESPNKIRTLIMADDTTYDAYHFLQYSGAALSAEGLYLNLIDAPYLSFDAPWWDYAYMKEMTVGGDKLYCLVGDYAVDRTRTLNCVFYNKKLYADYYGDADADGLYKEVLNGKWTMDYMRKICTEVYSDVNSDGFAGRDDVLGCCLNTLSNMDCLYYGAGANITSRDKDDVPFFDLLTEKNTGICEKLYNLVYDTDGVFISGSSFEEEMENRKKFSENTSMFLVGFFYTAESLRDMNADYGIIPVPKYDEQQSDYITGLHNIMRDIALPKNCKNVDATCAVLEELAYQGSKTVIPAYYEVVLKNKYARDEMTSQMLDIIKNNCTTDIAYVYGTYFNNMGLLHRNMISQKLSSLSSLYAASESAGKEKMQVLIDQFMQE